MTSELEPTTVIRSIGTLAAILDIAVRDRRLADNPTPGVKLPTKLPQPPRLPHAPTDRLRSERCRAPPPARSAAGSDGSCSEHQDQHRGT